MPEKREREKGVTWEKLSRKKSESLAVFYNPNEKRDIFSSDFLWTLQYFVEGLVPLLLAKTERASIN